MLFRVLFFLSLAAIAAGCIGAAWMVTRRPLKPFARNLLIVLIVFEIITAAMHLFALNNLFPPFWDWFFDLQYEYNLGSIFSALQLMVVAVAALINSLLTPGLNLWQRGYWLLLTAAFAFLGLDEFYSFHETLGSRVPTEAWRIPYAIAGGFLFLASVGAFWFGFRSQIRLFVMLFMGLVITAVAGIGVEEFVMRGFVEESSRYTWMYVFEEVFEMVGATIILAGFISYMQENISVRGWLVAKRVLVAAGSVWTLWMLFSMLLLPAVEARFFATPLQVDFADGLSLVGYRMSPETVKPGGEVELTLYWRASQALPEDYSLSIHALSHPDIDSLAQSDDLHIGPTPSSAWFPHIVMKRNVYLQLPENLPAPESYWLMLRVWFGPWPLGRPWQDTTGLSLVSSGDRAQFASDAIILDHVVALADSAPPPPATQARYDFPAQGFALAGYELPQQPIDTHELPVKFWWETERAVERDLTQFFHLMPENGDEVYAFDQQPFGGQFPTSDWPANLDVVDAWTVTLPADLPPGKYRVLTGFYDVQTLERMAVVNGDGQPLENNAIVLGTIEYAPDA